MSDDGDSNSVSSSGSSVSSSEEESDSISMGSVGHDEGGKTKIFYDKKRKTMLKVTQKQLERLEANPDRPPKEVLQEMVLERLKDNNPEKYVAYIKKRDKKKAEKEYKLRQKLESERQVRNLKKIRKGDEVQEGLDPRRIVLGELSAIKDQEGDRLLDLSQRKTRQGQ